MSKETLYEVIKKGLIIINYFIGSTWTVAGNEQSSRHQAPYLKKELDITVYGGDLRRFGEEQRLKFDKITKR